MPSFPCTLADLTRSPDELCRVTAYPALPCGTSKTRGIVFKIRRTRRFQPAVHRRTGRQRGPVGRPQ